MKKKGNGFLKILIVLLLLCCALFIGIPIIVKYSGFYDKPEGDILPDDTLTDESEKDPGVITSEIPESVPNRGIAIDNLMATAESSRSLPSRSDFENIDKESSVEEIIEQFGNCGYEGSGIIYHVWMLDDGSKAKLVFNSKGKIEFIYIVTDDHSERIYDRDNSDLSR